jgi:D-alanine transaminase
VHVYLNGKVVPAHEARISPFDRGFLFGDGVYEVVRQAVTPGGTRCLVGAKLHAQRLQDSLASVGIRFDAHHAESGLVAICKKLIGSGATEIGGGNSVVYVQVTRGTPPLDGSVAWRSHVPQSGLNQTIFAFARAAAPIDWASSVPPTKRVITSDDLRWHRCDIKSVNLLGNVLATIEASEKGADESILIRRFGDSQGSHGGSGESRSIVSEGALTSVVVVREDGRVVTPSLVSASILPSVTRRLVLELSADHDLPEFARVHEDVVVEEDLRHAREVMLIGTTTMVASVSHVDGVAVGAKRQADSQAAQMPDTNTAPGPVACALHQSLLRAVAKH